MCLKIYHTDGVRAFEAWGCAREMWDLIKFEGMEEEFEEMVLEVLADAHGFVDETAINDLLWFEPDAVCEYLGLEVE